MKRRPIHLAETKNLLSKSASKTPQKLRIPILKDHFKGDLGMEAQYLQAEIFAY
jgi:hypothetical protein